jgi:hypothetical protein
MILVKGKTVDVNLSDSLKLRTKAHVTGQVAELGLLSPGASTSFQFSPTSSSYADGEKYKFAVSKKLPWSLSSGVSYGSTSDTVKASLEKQLTPQITGVVDSRRPVHADQASATPPEETVQLKYQLSF